MIGASASFLDSVTNSRAESGPNSPGIRPLRTHHRLFFPWQAHAVLDTDFNAESRRSSSATVPASYFKSRSCFSTADVFTPLNRLMLWTHHWLILLILRRLERPPRRKFILSNANHLTGCYPPSFEVERPHLIAQSMRPVVLCKNRILNLFKLCMHNT